MLFIEGPELLVPSTKEGKEKKEDGKHPSVAGIRTHDIWVPTNFFLFVVLACH